MTSLATATAAAAQKPNGLFGRVDRWLHIMPHPSPAIEIAPTHVVVVRWDGSRLESHAAEQLDAGALMPSPVEMNVTQPDGIRDALRRIFSRIGNLEGHAALLVPDPVVRVFILPFETFPRRAQEAVPLLRWRLKKSVPFDVEETSISWFRQAARDGSLEVVAAVARRSVLREYENLVTGLGVQPSVVLSSTLATLPLIGESGSTLLLRLSGRTLTTAIVRGSTLCLYRSTEVPGSIAQFDPKWLLEEIFPAAAYYQDTWGESIDRVLLAGLEDRSGALQATVEKEMNIALRSLSDGDGSAQLDRSARDLMQHGFYPLVGWMANAGA